MHARASRFTCLLLTACLAGSAAAESWSTWGGDPGGSRYSSLAQINRDNVDELEIAWQFRTGALEKYPPFANQFAGVQVNPILLPPDAGGHVVVCTPFNDVIAIDPVTGAEQWRYEPDVLIGGYGSDEDPDGKRGVPFNKCRGVSYWQDDAAADPDAACVHRILTGTNDLRLIALDARSGEGCEDFGDGGEANVEALYMDKAPVWRNEVRFYSPPAVINDLMVIGTWVRDNHRYNSPRGTVRAFSVRSGELAWEWDPVPRVESDPEYAGWEPEAAAQTGGGNAWGVMSSDAARDLVFVPTSGPSPDFYGGTRPGDNRYADSIVALRASTGEVVWHFQTIHHNVWDYDNGAQPVLVDLEKEGRPFPAVIQATKTGMLYIFHRETGEPYFEIEERPVPGGGVVGEILSPTQPFPVAPPPLVPQDFTADDYWWLTFGSCADKYAGARLGPIFTPPSVEGTIIVPSTAGGVNWGSVAIDKPSNTLVVNVMNLLHYARLVPNDEVEDAGSEGGEGTVGALRPLHGTPYHLYQESAMTPYFVPCNKPPWTKLMAVDLEAGTIKWERPLGTIDKLSPIPLPINWGAPSFGGGIVTAGGLIFIGATADNRFRAFDIDTGEELWDVKLPTSSFAHPMTYQIDGRQYVVIASGGHPFVDQDPGDYVTAFALPAD